MQVKVYFTNSKGSKLCGILSNPTNTKEKPIVILAHGFRSGKDSNTCVRLEDLLNKNKISTFRFDFFGHGESEGKLEDVTVSELVNNILKAISFLKKQGYKKIGLFGASFGGTASVIATSNSKDILFLALKSPGMGQQSRKLSLISKDFKNKVWIRAGKKVKVPTIIIHGDQDEDVEFEQATQLSKSIKNSKLEIIKGADHRYTNPEHFEKCIDLIAEFIIKNI